MVSALDSGSKGLDSSETWQGNCAVFLGKTIHFQSATLHPEV